jgi:hypothetical protein
MLVQAKRGVLCWAMGLLIVHGVGNVLALANLALAGMARPSRMRPPAHPRPLERQGVGSVG